MSVKGDWSRVKEHGKYRDSYERIFRQDDDDDEGWSKHACIECGGEYEVYPAQAADYKGSCADCVWKGVNR